MKKESFEEGTFEKETFDEGIIEEESSPVYSS